MDVYTRKANFKLLLIGIAVLIGVSTVLYTNYLTNRMSNEEERKAKLWADAIERKAKLVRYTKELFSQLAADERRKVDVWAQSTKFLLSVNDNEMLTFFNDMITSNKEIPVILTDETGAVIAIRNIDLPEVKNMIQLPDKLRNEFKMYPPIIVDYKTNKNYIYYKDSNLFAKLKSTLSDLVETFIEEVVVNTASAPVILTDEKQRVIDYGNVDSVDIHTPERFQKLIAQMSRAHAPIVADLGEGVKRYIYYDDSTVLKQLKFFPFIQLGIFTAFILIAYLAFSNARKAEQNMVWVGMAKETAHQLGTPISSLSGWVEYLKEMNDMRPHAHVLDEFDHDINRLALVADRFSKIGSQPVLLSESVKGTLERNLDYMRRRVSQKVQLKLNCNDDQLKFRISPQLFDWVLENLLKNAIDAMDGEGKIEVEVSVMGGYAVLDISDTGKGIPSAKWSTIFEPGFSTKRRGWGLGLSLTKRIVEEYHNGRIFVKSSEVGNGTTFRIQIPKG